MSAHNPRTIVCLLALSAVAAHGCRKAAPQAPTGKGKEITTTGGVEMVLIPAGEFMMGSDGGNEDERPVRRVRVDAFYIDKYEVTQKAYTKLLGRNPSKFKAPDRPVERLSWSAAARYCNMRSRAEGLGPCYDPDTMQCDFDADGYRLPTEAEWEYACRAGTATAYSFGSDPAMLRRHAWFKANGAKTTHPVGGKRPNPWGLHDMHGNVAEWCNDRYGDSQHAAGSPMNPRGPSAGDERVLRGGSWRSSPDACRCAARDRETPGLADVCFGYEAYGFRCVRKGK